MQALRQAVAAVIVTGLFLLAVIFGQFRERDALTPEARVPFAVVFTGQYDRIETALALFEQGRFDRMLISGVNPKAGLSPDTIADQFRFSPMARAALSSGKIELSPDAADTFQNASETACWLAAIGGVTDVLLVTSPSHMPRASITLQRALPAGVRVHRAITAPRADDQAQRRKEFAKFAAAWVATLFPAGRRPGAHLTRCLHGTTP